MSEVRNSKAGQRVRAHPRTFVEIEARCLIVAGFAADVLVTNISAGGCEVRAKAGYLSEGWSVGIAFEGMNPLRGVVCWTSDTTVGVRFAARLSSSVHRRLLERSRTAPRLQQDAAVREEPLAS
ncbi:MAG: PilZ domain-containing protein [Novosphingobium sp.]